MINELFILGGYGQYVWPAFIFTFALCLSLYIKTKQQLQKQEEIFLNEFKEFRTIKEKVVKNKENAREIWSGRSI